MVFSTVLIINSNSYDAVPKVHCTDSKNIFLFLGVMKFLLGALVLVFIWNHAEAIQAVEYEPSGRILNDLR